MGTRLRLVYDRKWLDGSRTAQKPDWKQHDAAQQPEHAVNRNADDPEGNEKDPDQGIRDQRQDGERPAKNQQDAPGEERSHRLKYDPQ